MAGKPSSKPSSNQNGMVPAPVSPSGDREAIIRHIASGNDKRQGTNNYKFVCGSEYVALNNVLANQALQTLWVGSNPSQEQRDTLRDAAMSALMEFEPKDGIEGMMAAQAVGLHSAAMECLRRAMIADQPFEAADKLRKQAANMTRAFLDVLAALDRKRGKGRQQVVRVERVMVGPGGQAVVGNIQAGAALGTGQHGGGVGREAETEGEPHAPPAQLAHDAAFGPILPSMRGADTGRDALPVTSDAQRTVPDARRT